MRKNQLFIILFALAGLVFVKAQTASANDLINNSAYGVVNGSITQSASNSGQSVLNIGSIVNKSGTRVSNVKIKAVIDGDVNFKTGPHDMALNIGSVNINKKKKR